MTNAELIARINANIKANGREQINGEELNFILRQILGLIVSAGANWGDISGTITDQTDLIGLLNAKFDDPTGTNAQYIRGDGSLETFPAIPDVSGLQSKPVVVNSSTTAQNDTIYYVVANATFTDPTPVTGRGYIVVVLAGTANLSGSSFNIPGSIIYRVRLSTSWVNHRFLTYEQLLNFLVPTSRTINGLDLTTNRTLTTANINDSTDRRYVTDSQLTVIGNTSGINTGDETQSSILSKLGFYFNKISAPSSTLTGTLSETIMATHIIPANTLTGNNDALFFFSRLERITTTANVEVRLLFNSVNSITSGSPVQVGILTMSGLRTVPFERIQLTVVGTSLVVRTPNTSLVSDNTSANTTLYESLALPALSGDIFFFLTARLLNTGDQFRVVSSLLKNF